MTSDRLCLPHPPETLPENAAYPSRTLSHRMPRPMYCNPETAVNVPAATKSPERMPGGIASGHDTLTNTIATDAS